MLLPLECSSCFYMMLNGSMTTIGDPFESTPVPLPPRNASYRNRLQCNSCKIHAYISSNYMEMYSIQNPPGALDLAEVS